MDLRPHRKETPLPPSPRRKGLGRVRKELVGRFYQLLLGHAAMGEHLMRVGQALGDNCWWCGSGETDVLPPVGQVPTLDAGDSKDVGESREGL